MPAEHLQGPSPDSRITRENATEINGVVFKLDAFGGAVAHVDRDDRTSHKHDVRGQPLQTNNLGQREFARLIKTADVKRIRLHDLRHTCATLMFQAGVPVKVIQERLGHKRIEMTLGIYAHVLPSMQQDAAPLERSWFSEYCSNDQGCARARQKS